MKSLSQYQKHRDFYVQFLNSHFCFFLIFFFLAFLACLFQSRWDFRMYFYFISTKKCIYAENLQGNKKLITLLRNFLNNIMHEHFFWLYWDWWNISFLIYGLGNLIIGDNLIFFFKQEVKIKLQNSNLVIL